VITASGAVRPYPGESVSGDAFVIEVTGQGHVLALVDALGHGPVAAEVARLAVETIRAHVTETPLQIIEHCHQRLLRGRGAAISVIVIGSDGKGRFAGVGNVRARVFPESVRQPALIGVAGVVGHRLRTMRETTFTLPIDGLGIIHSDGVSSRIDPIAHKADSTESAARGLLAAYGGRTDDACVLVFAHEASLRFASGGSQARR
jgi:hypothetical protein